MDAMKGLTMVDDNTTKEATTTTPPPTPPAKPKPKLTKFRAHFRRSNDNERHTMDVDSKDIGDVHEAVRKKHQIDDVKVFIDKVKVLGGES